MKEILIILLLAGVLAWLYFRFVKKPKAYTTGHLDMEDGRGLVAAVYLPIEPHGVALFTAEDDSEASAALIHRIIPLWPAWWPQMRAYLERAMIDYGLDTKLGRDEIVGAISVMTPGCFMADHSDISVSIFFTRNTEPMWDFFMKETVLVHSQPVF